MSIRRNVLTAGAVLSIGIATPMIGGWEGVETKPYKDIVGVWTVCYGETQDIDFNKEYTLQDCDDMLAKRVPEYYNSAMKNIPDHDVHTKNIVHYSDYYMLM